MLSRRLWLSLNQPATPSPLARLLPPAPKSHRDRNRLLFTFIILPTFGLLCALFGPALFGLSWLAGLLPFGLSALFNLTAFGWTQQLVAVLERYRGTGWWDLLSLLPPGALEICWWLSQSWTQQPDRQRRLKADLRIVRILVLTVLVMTVIVLCTLTMWLLGFLIGARDFYQARGEVDIFLWLLSALAFAGGLYLDCVQTMVLAVVTAIFGTVEAGSGVQARLVAGGAFAIIQAVVYGLMILIGYIVLPSLLTPALLNNPFATLGLVLARFVVLCGARELALTLLWRRLTDRLGDDSFLLIRSAVPSSR